MARAFFDDGKYSVTAAVIATPRRIYPLVNSTAGIRRDPLWVGVAISALSAGSIAIYGDLLTNHEVLAASAFFTTAPLIGGRFAFLRIASLGHKPAFILTGRKRAAALYRAIADARVDNGAIIANPSSE